MEIAGVNFVLAAAGFLLWTTGGSAAPMECHFNSRGEITRSKTFFLYLENKIHLYSTSASYLCSFLTSMCCSTVCFWGEALLSGWNLDGRRLHAVHLSAPCWCRLLWDVSTQTTSEVWCPDAQSYYSNCNAADIKWNEPAGRCHLIVADLKWWVFRGKKTCCYAFSLFRFINRAQRHHSLRIKCSVKILCKEFNLLCAVTKCS